MPKAAIHRQHQGSGQYLGKGITAAEETHKGKKVAIWTS
jgi:hypothetical protein